MTTIITYNIPGSENNTGLVFSYTTSLINFLERYGPIENPEVLVRVIVDITNI
jgi:hypothetical protein